MNYYENHEFISASLLKVFIDSPQKAHHYINEGQKQSEALTLGRCFHEMMEKKQSFQIFDESQRPEPLKTFASKANKEWKASQLNQDCDVITLAQYTELKNMVDKVHGSEFYKGLTGTKLEGIEKEFYYTFPNGNKAKCKPDALYNGKDGSIICVDWKTTADKLTGSTRKTNYLVSKFKYDIQAVHYSEILKNVLEKDIHFFFVFVEKSAPYDVLPVYINPNGEYYNFAFETWNDGLTDINESFKTNNWKTLEQSIENKYISL